MDFSVSPEQEAFVATVRQFAGRALGPHAADVDAAASFPRSLIAEAAKLGLMGVRIPKEHGGAGRDAVTYALAIETVALASATVAVILAVNNSLVAEPILAHGTPAQKEAWLSKLASGQAIGAFALSEANAGSDAANQETTAKSDGDGFVLRGRKVWVANAEVADVVIVFAVTRPGMRGRGISAFLVPMTASGVTRSACDSLGVRGLGCRTHTSTPPPSPPPRCLARRIAASVSRCARWKAAGSRLRPRRSGSDRRPSIRRWPTRASVRRSGNPSATSRRFSFSSPTWRPIWRRRAC